jgi:hypothetical protein
MRVPRVSSVCEKMGYKKVSKPKSFKKGVHISPKHAAPGDVAWVGDCEGKTRRVCYFDVNMDPSDCRNVPC